MARIAVDALGGDRAPGEIVAGAVEAAADGIDVTLFGPAGLETQGLPLVETTQLGMHSFAQVEDAVRGSEAWTASIEQAARTSPLTKSVGLVLIWGAFPGQTALKK